MRRVTVNGQSGIMVCLAIEPPQKMKIFTLKRANNTFLTRNPLVRSPILHSPEPKMQVFVVLKILPPPRKFN